MSDLKQQQIFKQKLTTAADKEQQTPMAPAKAFDDSEHFVANTPAPEAELAAEQQLETVIRPGKKGKWLGGTLFTLFSALLVWQAGDWLWHAWLDQDWLSLGWGGFLSVLAALGLGTLGKELYKLRRLRQHFSVQEQSESMLTSDAVGHGKAFCEKLAKQGGISAENPAYDRWLNSIAPEYSDRDILDLYDALVVREQDKQATQLVSRYATESAALVAVSPLALADMLLVAWRNYKMINKLAKIYGVELGYASRLSLFKSVLINMAAAGASEMVIDAGMDLMSMDLAAKLSARAGQGLGVGILTARLGLKTMTLLRPTPWHPQRRVRLTTIRKQIMAKIRAISVKS